MYNIKRNIAFGVLVSLSAMCHSQVLIADKLMEPNVQEKVMLELNSNDKALYLTRVNNPELDITNPQLGMMVYDTTKGCFRNYYENAEGNRLWGSCYVEFASDFSFSRSQITYLPASENQLTGITNISSSSTWTEIPGSIVSINNISYGKGFIKVDAGTRYRYYSNHTSTEVPKCVGLDIELQYRQKEGAGAYGAWTRLNGVSFKNYTYLNGSTTNNYSYFFPSVINFDTTGGLVLSYQVRIAVRYSAENAGCNIFRNHPTTADLRHSMQSYVNYNRVFTEN